MEGKNQFEQVSIGTSTEEEFAEAKFENDLRDDVVESAIMGIERNEKEKEVIAQVVQRFLTEEFKIQGFNKIEDSKERGRVMQEFIEDIIFQVQIRTDYEPDYKMDLYSDKIGEKVGNLLKNLVGKNKTIADAEKFFVIASGGRNDIIVSDYIRQHLGTLNFLRANSFEFKVYPDPILGERFNFFLWKSFEEKIKKYWLIADVNKAIVPCDADEELKKKIEVEFQKHKKEAQDWEKTIIEKEKAKLKTEIKEVEKEFIKILKQSPVFQETKKIKDLFEKKNEGIGEKIIKIEEKLNAKNERLAFLNKVK